MQTILPPLNAVFETVAPNNRRPGSPAARNSFGIVDAFEVARKRNAPP
jgi:hypothetical protein